MYKVAVTEAIINGKKLVGGTEFTDKDFPKEVISSCLEAGFIVRSKSSDKINSKTIEKPKSKG